jgi:hypothetical protein
MKDQITIKISKNKLGYTIKYDKFVNLIPYGPGENETITEVHNIDIFESNLRRTIEGIIEDELK